MMKLRIYLIISQSNSFIIHHLSYTGVNLFSFIFFTDEGEERGAGLLEMHMDEPDEDDDYGYDDDE